MSDYIATLHPTSPERLTIAQLMHAWAVRCEESFFPVAEWSNSDYVMALVGELGEAANELKKIKRGDYKDDVEKHNAALRRAGIELVDALAYLFLLVVRLGLQDMFERLIVEKFNQVSKDKGSIYRLPELT